jgi:hypothetical protein
MIRSRRPLSVPSASPAALVVLLIVVLGAFQGIAAAQSGEKEKAVDVLVLRNGSTLEGRIVREIGNLVEFRIDPSTVVGLERRQIESILRAEDASAQPASEPESAEKNTGNDAAEPSVDPGLLEGRHSNDTTAGTTLFDQTCVLRNPAGAALGWLQTTITSGEDGTRRIGEEWRFFEPDGGRTEVTRLDVVDAEHRPLSSFYHERQYGVGDRALSARVVHAEWNGGALDVRIEDSAGSRRASYEAPAGTRFPLELRDSLRELHDGPEDPTFTVFDVCTQQFDRRVYAIRGMRQVVVDGEPKRVRVLEIDGSSGRHIEWLDGGSRSVRREIVGGDLVAIPDLPSRLRAMRRLEADRFEPSFRVEPGNRFALVLPNGMWTFDGETGVDGEDGRLVARCEPFGAVASVFALDHLDPRMTVESAGDAAARWFGLLYGDFAVEDRRPVQGNHGRSMHLHGTFRAVGERERRKVDIRVFHASSGLLALVCHAPAPVAAEFRQDFDEMFRRIETRPEELRLLVPDQVPASAGR